MIDMFKETISAFLYFVSQKDFEISFWSSFFSAILVSIIIGLTVDRFTSIFKRPKLLLVVKQGNLYKDKIALSRREDGDYEASFYFAIKNSGRKTIQPHEGYWHIYFPTMTKVEKTAGVNDYSSAGEKSHHRDLIKSPVFGKSFLDIGGEYKFITKKETASTDYIAYFFSTSYGYFPKNIQLDQHTGFVPYKDMGRIEFVLPNENL